MANRKMIEPPEEAHDAETEVAVALTEAKTHAVTRIVTPRLLWIIVVALVLYYSIKGVIWVFYALTGILLLVVLAIFFAYLVAPLVEMVHRPFRLQGRERLLPRAAAIGIVYLVLFGSLALTAWILAPRISDQLEEFAKQAPNYLTNARLRADKLNQLYQELNIPPAVRKSANDAVTNGLNRAGDYVAGHGFENALSVLGFVPWLILVPILAFFFLKDAESFRRSALKMIPRGRLRWRGDEFFQDVNSTLAAYIRAQLIACLLIGTVCTIGFVLLGMPYALVLGIIAGVFEFIPLLGPLVVACIAVVVASFVSGGKVLAVLLFLSVLRIIHDYITYPRIIGSGIHLHPLAVILAILSGHELAGVTGIFLAIPVIAILTVTYRHWLEHRGGTGLVAELLKPTEQAITANAAAAEELPPVAPTPTRPST